MEQLNARKALSHLSEEFPDLSSKEVLRQQKELIRQIQAQSETSTIRKKKSKESTSDKAQVDANPDDFVTSNPNENTDTDKECLDTLNIIALSTVVDSHNAEEDEEDKRLSEEVKRTVDREDALLYGEWGCKDIVQRAVPIKKLMYIHYLLRV